MNSRRIVLTFGAIAAAGVVTWIVYSRFNVNNEHIEFARANIAYREAKSAVVRENLDTNEMAARLDEIRKNELEAVTESCMRLDGLLRTKALEWVEAEAASLKLFERLADLRNATDSSPDNLAHDSESLRARIADSTARMDELNRITKQADEDRENAGFLWTQVKGLLSDEARAIIRDYDES